MGFDTAPVTVRLIRVKLDSGETEILVTSLTDQKAYPKELFKELYNMRWPVEEDYKTLKYRLQIENLKYPHQIIFAQALAKMKDTIVMLFNSSRKKLIEYVEQISEIFIQTTEAIRPNRKYPRRHRVKQARFYLEYKTTC